MTYKIGDRVGALQSADKDEVKLYGYGTYQGREVPDEQAGGMGRMMRDAGCDNPKILLDDGHVVWGCECWWGPEDKIRASIGGRTVTVVDLSNRAVQPPTGA